ncbi:hypothetical protein [Noviherbaspirillum galbum]|uniref:DegT/DnrJ/EryC1/StrS aminotransferase family protein n=1 Tax=Noviherbaspirillum galbum TaxID=2709383 RepID=A0A6B3SYU2_9BURK|nr:hypothetical protein [Noviherbaspirillum galbum]NEX64032.1 hypothetical protein [Noviherbaspirillum galbum]
MQADRWEQGSDFHLPAIWHEAHADLLRAPATPPWRSRAHAYASGRDAFHALIGHGMQTRGWRRLWVPSYYCQRVVASLVQTGISLAVYTDGPDMAAPELDEDSLREGDVLLAVNFFGLRAALALPPSLQSRLELIEDHTHDPWSPWAAASTADWCVASLRKTLPLPDGGMLWSPGGHALPAAPVSSPQRDAGSQRRLAAMLLKAMYLDGAVVEKAVFRQLYLEAEQALDEAGTSAMTAWAQALNRVMPVASMRPWRRRNWDRLAAAVESMAGAADTPAVRVLRPDDAQACPLGCQLVFDTPSLRDAIRERLNRERIYTAVLWPLDTPVLPGVPARHRRLGKTMLSIHCDNRYGEADMERVADALGNALAEEARAPLAQDPPAMASLALK